MPTISRSCRHVLELHANESDAQPHLYRGPLADGQQQRGEDHGRSLILAGQAQKQVDAVRDLVLAARRHAHEVADEGEERREPRQPVAGWDGLNQPAGEIDDGGVAGQGDDQAAKRRP